MPKRSEESESALFVRLPASAIERLRKAAEALGVAKKDLVASLVTTYVDPDSRKGLQALDAMTRPRPLIYDGGSPTYGSYSFQADATPEVLTVEQAAELLQVEAKLVLELAESGDLPGRRLGKTWRFSRAAVLAWLAAAG